MKTQKKWMASLVYILLFFTLTTNAVAESNISIIVTSYDFYGDSKTWDELQPFYQDKIKKILRFIQQRNYTIKNFG